MKYNFTAKRHRLENGRVAWIMESELKGCVAQAYTLDDAIRELEINENEWVETATKYGIPVPDESI